MNTKIVTMMDLAFSASDHDFPIHEGYRKAAVALEIANRSIVALEARGRMKAGEIANAIGDAGINWRGERTKVSAQQVGCVMRKLVNIGRVKREEVEGEPIEITIPAVEEMYYDFKKHDYVSPHPAYTKTITPKTAYYSLV